MNSMHSGILHAFGKPCLCPRDTCHFRHFRRLTGSEQQSPCFTGSNFSSKPLLMAGDKGTVDQKHRSCCRCISSVRPVSGPLLAISNIRFWTKLSDRFSAKVIIAYFIVVSGNFLCKRQCCVFWFLLIVRSQFCKKRHFWKVCFFRGFQKSVSLERESKLCFFASAKTQ